MCAHRDAYLRSVFVCRRICIRVEIYTYTRMHVLKEKEV